MDHAVGDGFYHFITKRCKTLTGLDEKSSYLQQKTTMTWMTENIHRHINVDCSLDINEGQDLILCYTKKYHFTTLISD